MSYGRNFGFRSFENLVRDGRFRVPATGTPLKIGEPVMLDVATPGQVIPATEAVDPGQNTGIVVFEHIQNKSDALTTAFDSPYDSVPLGAYAQVVRGPGAKVWFKNTVAKTLYDGRVRAAYSPLVDNADAPLTIVATLIGKGLVPAGSGKWRVTDGSATANIGGKAWLVVEQANPSTGVVEARLTF